MKKRNLIISNKKIGINSFVFYSIINNIKPKTIFYLTQKLSQSEIDFLKFHNYKIIDGSNIKNNLINNKDCIDNVVYIFETCRVDLNFILHVFSKYQNNQNNYFVINEFYYEKQKNISGILKVKNLCIVIKEISGILKYNNDFINKFDKVYFSDLNTNDLKIVSSKVNLSVFEILSDLRLNKIIQFQPNSCQDIKYIDKNILESHINCF